MIPVFRDVIMFSLVKNLQRFGEAVPSSSRCSFFGWLDAESEGRTFFLNVGNHLPVNTALTCQQTLYLHQHPLLIVKCVLSRRRQLLRSCAWGMAGVLLKEENQSTRTEACPCATLSNTNPRWAGLALIPGLRGESPATSRLIHGTALYF
jgi:hypothetical protein